MTEVTQIREVVINAKRRTEGSGLSIPVTEISTSRQTIDAKEFEGLPMTTVDEALQGRIAGLDIISNSGNLGSGTSMRLRGVSSINGSSEPLIVVDGNVWETDASSNFDYNNANDEKFAELLNVNPDDIASISVLKDADRKSTRVKSSHQIISYAVFCLKKKKKFRTVWRDVLKSILGWQKNVRWQIS